MDFVYEGNRTTKKTISTETRANLLWGFFPKHNILGSITFFEFKINLFVV
jgi:hypothetical protein